MNNKHESGDIKDAPAERWVSVGAKQLCDHFQVSRTAVWKAINQLKEEGYEIEAVRNKGYRIVDIPDRITADAIKSCLETKWMAKNLEYYDEIDSTNNRAKALGETGGADGTLFVAETQTAGEKEDAADAGNHRRATVFPCRFC